MPRRRLKVLPFLNPASVIVQNFKLAEVVQPYRRAAAFLDHATHTDATFGECGCVQTGFGKPSRHRRAHQHGEVTLPKAPEIKEIDAISLTDRQNETLDDDI